MWGGSIKIGARPFWGRGVFVLVISNINIGFQKSLTPPLNMNFNKGPNLVYKNILLFLEVADNVLPSKSEANH